MECASSESENTDEEFERHAAGSEDSTDEGDTGDEEDSGPFQAPNGVTFYEALPPDLSANFALAYGLSIVHTFSTGWEIGILKGEEKRNKRPQREYIVKYPSEKRPYWHNLDPSEYGADKYWVLLTIDK